MLTLISGLGLFLVAVLIQVTIWRFRVPRHQSAVLAAILVAVFLTGVGALSALGSKLDTYAPWTWMEPWLSPANNQLSRRVLIALLYGSLAMLYFFVFDMVRRNSPTPALLALIFANRSQGIGREQLVQVAWRPGFTQSILDQVLHDRLAAEKDQKLRVGRLGLAIVSMIAGCRRVLAHTRARA